MFNKNPTIVINAVAELVRVVIPMLIVFGILHWTDQQIAAVMLVVGVAVTSLATVLTRAQVTPNERVDALITTATEQPAGTPVEAVKAIQEKREGV